MKLLLTSGGITNDSIRAALVRMLGEPTLGVVDFSIAIDEQSAISVVDGVVEVISEGEWTRFDPER